MTEKLEKLSITVKEKEEKIDFLKEINISLEEKIQNFKEQRNKMGEEISMIKTFQLVNDKKEINNNQLKELQNFDLKLFEKQKDAPIRSGTFGSVSKVKHSQNGKIYAIKSFTQVSSSLNKIQREISLWKILQTLPEKPSAIPNFHGSFKEYLNLSGEAVHLIFDYFPYSLKNVIDDVKSNKNPALSFDQILQYAEKLINGLAFLQTMKMCHRDLKPANLLMNETLKEIFIIDLGESKEIFYDLPEETKKEMTITGSPKYFSPELDVAFNKNMEKTILNPFKSDVFSFGLILLELGILEVPNKESDSLKKGIEKFEKTYKKIMKTETEQKKLELFIRILRQCLRSSPINRPDFLDLYFTFQKKFRTIDSSIMRIQILVGEKGKP